jgi:hypothetical protein
MRSRVRNKNEGVCYVDSDDRRAEWFKHRNMKGIMEYGALQG